MRYKTKSKEKSKNNCSEPLKNHVIKLYGYSIQFIHLNVRFEIYRRKRKIWNEREKKTEFHTLSHDFDFNCICHAGFRCFGYNLIKMKILANKLFWKYIVLCIVHIWASVAKAKEEKSVEQREEEEEEKGETKE